MIFADRILGHGQIITLDPAKPTAEALAVRGGRIVAVGTDDEMAELAGPGTRFSDLGGCAVVPGFHDAHCHILLFGLSLTEVNVREASTISEIARAVAERAGATPAGAWIRGGGIQPEQADRAAPPHPRRPRCGGAAASRVPVACLRPHGGG
jgi:predicted amidohydrolase YtcJ